MGTDIEIIIIIAGLVLAILLLFILLFIKPGVLTHRKQQGTARICVTRDGRNVDGYDCDPPDIGLHGFGEDKSGTVLIGVSRKLAECRQVCFISQKTGMRYSCVIMDLTGVGRQNTNHFYQEFLRITEDPSISKIHAEIIRNGADIYIRDMGSANHTWVNGRRVTEPVLLHTGDMVKMGNTEFKADMKDK